MDRYKMLPCYHYVENEDGVINNPATDKVRTCTISGNHGKNLIPFPYVGKAGTQNGVTIAVDSDGVITLNGTATASIYFGLMTVTQAITKPGAYTVSGAPGVSGVSVQCKVDGVWGSASVDLGQGATFTVSQRIEQVTVQINSGTVCDNVVVKPMLEEGESVTAFEPWCGVGDKTRNLIPYPYEETTKTTNGVTFTDNGDGTITANGTATGVGASFLVFSNSSGLVGQGRYYLSGCPSNDDSTVSLQPKIDDEWNPDNYDFGNGQTITVQSSLNKISCVISSGKTVDNAIFKPMLVDLTTQNLIPYPYARTTQTINGVTFTDNGDGTITVNGTATGNAWYPISTRSASTIYATKGKYHLSGCPSGGGNLKYYLQCNVYNDTTQVIAFNEFGSGTTRDLNSYTFTSISVNFTVCEGVTVENLTFRPLLVDRDDISSYEPYGYKIPILNDTRENLINVEDRTVKQINSYYANFAISLTDSNMSTYLPYLDEMKGKSIVCSYDLDNENFQQEFLIFYDAEVNGTNKYILFDKNNNFTATLPNATPIRLDFRARSNSADLNGTTVKISNISMKLADVDPETTKIYSPKQIMQGESATFNEPFNLRKANKLSVKTAVKPTAAKYTYYTY